MATTSTTIAAATTAGTAKEWSKTLREVANQTSATATDIGWLRNNDSRLNVVSALSATDKVQYFTMNAVSGGKFGIGTQSDQNIRVQVYDQHNRVVADSKANMGVASTNYTAMQHSNYDMKTGKYVVKVTRDTGVAANAVTHFAMQMKIGTTYTNDYVTQQVPLTQDQYAASLTSPTTTTNPTASILSTAMTGQSSLLGGTDTSGGAKGIFGILSTIA